MVRQKYGTRVQVLEKGKVPMPTQEERLNTLERTVALLEKKFNNADLQNINHNATMLLGLTYKQQADINEIKINLNEHTSRLDNLEAKSDKHTETLNEHTLLLNEHTSKLDNLEQHFKQLEAKSDKHTETLNEHTKLLTQMLALLTKFSNE